MSGRRETARKSAEDIKLRGSSSRGSASASDVKEKEDEIILSEMAAITNEEIFKSLMEENSLKLDGSSSSGGSAYDVKDGKEDDPDEDIDVLCEIAAITEGEILKTLMEDMIRDEAQNMASSSSASRALPSCSKEEAPLVYQKKLTNEDVYYCRLMVPFVDVSDYFPEPVKRGGKYEIMWIKFVDKNGKSWRMGASFDDKTRCYMVLVKWDEFVKEHQLKPQDKILLYYDASLDRFWIEYEKFDSE